MSKTKSANPAYPDAHPTAPGGMSQAALRVELAEKHHIPMDETKGVKWPTLIDMVIEQRQLREVEAVKPAKKNKAKKQAEPFTPYMDDLDIPEGTEPEEITPGWHAEKKKKNKKKTKKKQIEQRIEEGTATPDRVSGNALDVSLYRDTISVDSWPDRGAEQEAALRKEQMPELKARAKALGIKGFSTMRKDALIAEILKFRTAIEHTKDMNLNEVAFADVSEVETLPAPEDDVFDPETLFAEMMAARAEHEAENPPLFLGIPGIRDYVFDGHAGAGPSASERWMHCTMSLSASRDFLASLTPNQQQAMAGGNEAARQGTTAHAVGEVKANHMLGRVKSKNLKTTLETLATNPPKGEQYTDEMDEYVNEYVDLIKSYADERGAENILIERRVEAAIPLTGSHEEEVYIIRGSADAIALPTAEHPVLVVADLKYGEGIYVEVEDNSQAKIYALGVLGELVDDEGNLTVAIETVRIYIAQPRLGGIRSWEMSLEDLLDWRDGPLSEALTKALYGAAEGATYEPSEEACQFCPARGACPALAEQRMEAAAELFTVVNDAEFKNGPGSFPETTSLDDVALGSLLAQIRGLVDLYPDLKEEAQRRLYRGHEVPGFHLVNYTPPRKWKDAEKTLRKIAKMKGLTKAERKQLLKPPTLVTPKQAVTTLGEKAGVLEKMIEAPDKRPVIAPENDRRKAWEGPAPEAMFDDETGGLNTVEGMFPDA